jgi:hypothetical protein
VFPETPRQLLEAPPTALNVRLVTPIKYYRREAHNNVQGMEMATAQSFILYGKTEE